MEQHPKRHSITILGKTLKLPRSRFMRQLTGGFLVAGGLLGFLPVLGFWMLPLGLIILSHDSPCIRRIRRKVEIFVLRRWQASRFGKKNIRTGKKTKDSVRVT